MSLNALSPELYCLDFETLFRTLIAQSRTLLSQIRSKPRCFSRNTLTPSPELYCL